VAPLRYAVALAATLAITPAPAQTPAVAPPAPATQPYVPQAPILPPGLSAGDRELILLLIAERDRQYDQRFRAQEIAVSAALAAAKEAVAAALTAAKEAGASAFAAAKEAVDKAEKATQEHFASVNEFRKTLTDQTATFMPRTEADVRFRALEEKIALGAGRSEGSTTLWNGVLAVAGFLVAAAVLGLMFMRQSAPKG